MRRAAFLLALSSAIGCGRTEVVLLGASDLPGSIVAAVDVVAQPAGGAERHRCVCIAPPCDGSEVTAAWPLRAGLQPGRGDDSTFSITLRGYREPGCGAEPVISQRARVRFRPQRRIAVRMSLDGACLGFSCTGVDETCVEGACTSIDFPTEDITGDDPSIVDPIGETDAGIADDDLGVRTDGGVEPGADLAGMPDPLAETPIAMSSVGDLSRPVIVRDPAGYAVFYTSSTQAHLRRYPLAGTMTSLLDTLALPMPNVQVRPALVSDGLNLLLAWTGVGGGASSLVYDTPTAALQSIPLPSSNDGQPFTQIAGAADASGVFFIFGETAELQIVELPRAGNTYGILADVPAPAVALQMNDFFAGMAAVGSAGASGVTFAYNVDSFGGHGVYFSDAPVTYTDTSVGAPISIQILGVARTATDAIFVSHRTGLGLVWGRMKTTAGMRSDYAYAPFSPPINVVPHDLAAAFDGDDLVIVYSTGASMAEVVCTDDGTTLTCGTPRTLLLAGFGENIESVGFAPGPVPGGGRFVAHLAIGGSVRLVTKRRSATLQ